MKKNEIFTVVASILLAACFLGGIAVNKYENHRAMEEAINRYRVNFSAAEVIGPNGDFRGDPQSPYTLVEWGDYECPPCHGANDELSTLLPTLRGKVRFVFRNLPLTSIHPYAMRAAVDAEAARSHGKFWPLHDGYYNIDPGDFNNSTITTVESSMHIEPKQLSIAEKSAAVAVVRNDMNEANAIGLTGTPSFVLCGPRGQVVHLTLSQLSQFVH